MTKRTVEQTLRDEIDAQRAVVERLLEQEARRGQAVNDATVALAATRAALAEARERLDGLEKALALVAGEELDADASAG